MDEKIPLDAFLNVRPQIGSCGIWCGSCTIGNDLLSVLSTRYGLMLEGCDLEGWGPQNFSYEELFQALASLEQVPVCGRSDCEIRRCASIHEIEFCGSCPGFALCQHAPLIEHMRLGASQAGLLVDPSPTDLFAQVERWTVEFRHKWPGCILFDA
jgi:hypothetical protein